MRAIGRRTATAVVMTALAASATMPSGSPSGSGSSSPVTEASTGQVRIVTTQQADLEGRAAARVAAMTLQQRAATIVMGHVPTTDAAALRDYMDATGVGGFLLMGANIPAGESDLRRLTAALTVDAAFPPLIAIDQEGGDVSRLPWDDFPSALTLKSLPPQAARDAFAGRAALLLRAGIGVNFGIVADETDDPSMFIYRRALGTSPTSAAERVTAALEGEAPAALSTVKHFPGHGAAPGDSHAGVPSTSMSRAEWESADGVPFFAASDAGAPLLMFGHLAYTDVDPLPASLSETWHEIARDDLGFDGVAITDDLGMLEASGEPDYADPVENAVAAVAAGNDMVLTVMFSTPETAPAVIAGIVSAVESGRLPRARLMEAAERVTLLRLQVAAGGAGAVPCADC